MEGNFFCKKEKVNVDIDFDVIDVTSLGDEHKRYLMGKVNSCSMNARCIYTDCPINDMVGKEI